MKTTMHIMKLSAVFLALALACQASQAAEKLRVLDKGLDGNQRTYLVTCPDGSLSSVVQTFNTPTTEQEDLPPPNGVTPRAGADTTKVQVTQVCIQPGKGEQQVCHSSWDLDEAAQASCQ